MPHEECPGLGRALMAEALGTMLIVVAGCGVVATAVCTGAQVGLWQVAVVWGAGVAVAIHCTAGASGAHLNPAVTLAFWLVRPAAQGLTAARALAYTGAQLAGAVVGGVAQLALFGDVLTAYESQRGIVRGTAASVVTASAFGEYFPNPGFVGAPFAPESVTVAQALFVEAWGTLLLAFVIFALTHPRNPGPARNGLVPGLIGLTVAVLISLYAPFTQAGWNPARDLGPRLVAALAGWGSIALPGPQSGFWIYILGPCIGAPIGAFLAEHVLFGNPRG